MKWNYKEFSATKHTWQKENNRWESHTVPQLKAKALVNGYFNLLGKLGLYDANRNNCRVLDIGAGAGYISAACAELGCEVLSTEHTKEGVKLLTKHNPQLKTDILDVSSISTSDYDNKYNFIICRELYPFTRVNCFESQLESLCDICECLDDNGVLLFIGSTVAYPHCADYSLLFNTVTHDTYKYYGSYSEPFVSRKYILVFGVLWVKFVSYLLTKIIYMLNLKRRTKLADIKIYVIKKNK